MQSICKSELLFGSCDVYPAINLQRLGDLKNWDRVEPGGKRALYQTDPTTRDIC